MRLILFILFFSPWAAAQEIERAFQDKDYRRIAQIYLSNPKKKYKEKEYVIISYSLRKQKKYREDIKVVYGLVRRFYSQKHNEVLRAIKSGETLDSDEIPQPLKIHYWNLFNNYAFLLKKYDKKSPRLEKDHRHFRAFAKILSEVEFREGKVDRTVDNISAHLQYLDDKIYQFSLALSLQYVSWQQAATLDGPTGETGLIITNRGYCAGGEMGMENYLFHFYIDGCFLYGAGGVKHTGNAPVDYQQSNLPAYGFKAGPGASVIVSSSRSRIGIKVPMLYSIQKLTNPEEAGYSVSDNPEFSILTTLYSRWQFDKWFFQTEFGKYVEKESSFWGLGMGRSF